MKKCRYTAKTILAVIEVLLCLICVACSQEPQNPVEGYGTLEVRTAASSKTIEPSYEDRHCAGCIVHIRSLTTSYSNALTVENGHCIIDNLESGEYEVYVEGLNSNGTSILKSEMQKVVIRNKETTTATFRLNRYVEGVGTFSFSVSVPVNDDSVDGVVFTLFEATDEALEYPNTHIVVQPSLSTDGKYRMYSIELQLDAGSYNFAASMFQYKEGGAREQVGFTHIESLHVFNSTTSESSLVWDKEFFPVVSAPSITVAGGLCKEGTTVRLESSDPRAVIYYTTDGTEPTTNSNRYINPITIDRCVTLKAVSTIEGLRPSKVVEETYIVRVEDPVFSIKDKSMISGDRLEISTVTNDAIIWYTMDGTEPSSENGSRYTGPITLRKTVEIKAVATKEGLESSNVISAQYYDMYSSSPEKFFVATEKGAISINDDVPESEIPSVLIIPSTWKGIDVVEIAAGGFSGLSGVQNILLPDTIKKIGANAFNGCTEVESIDIGKYVEDIAGSAFSGWNENQRINDYSGQIRANTLNNCNARIYATVKTETQTVSGYTGMKNLYGITLNDNITAIEANAFSGCVNLEEFVLPSYVTMIGSLAFNDCTKIRSITLPKTLSTLADDAFTGWTNEQSIYDNSGKTLEMKFDNSSARIYVKIPRELNKQKVTEIPANAGAGRSDIYGLEIPDTVETIGDYAFEGTSIEKIVIPATVKSLGLEVFKGWNDSQNVEIIYGGYNAKVSDDGLHTPFTGTDAVFKVSIPSDVSEIKSDAFNGMTSLAEISIPDSVKTIGLYSFKGTSLRNVSLGDGVTSIGCGSFMDCVNLKDIDLGSKLSSIGENAFENCTELSSLVVPRTVEMIAASAFENCIKLSTVSFETDSSLRLIGDKVFAGCSSLSVVNIPDSVSIIGSEAFYNCTLLGAISFGKSVASIGPKAFAYCNSLHEIVLPDTVESIGDEIFSYCGSLVSVNLGSGISCIPTKAFVGSSNIKTIAAPNCMGSMVVTIKVPLNQMIVHDVAIGAEPVYASSEGPMLSTQRGEQNSIEDGCRVFTCRIPSLLGLDYYVSVLLVDVNGKEVGYSNSNIISVEAGKESNVEFEFSMSDLEQRPLTNTVITPSSGTILDGEEVKIENPDSDAIYYTLDGRDPSPEKGVGILYTEPIVLHSLEIIKAIAIKEGYAHSAVARTTFSNMKTLPPRLLLDSSVTYPSTQYVEIKPVTEGSSIIYTLDGTNPSDAGLEYTGPIEIGETTTLRAVAWKKGFLPSDEVSTEYVISIPSHEVETPVVRNLSIERNVEDGNVSFEAVLSPSSDNATYEWYLDGEKVCTDKVYTFPNDTELGWHIIEAKAKVDGRSYSSELMYEHKGWYRMEFYEKWAKDPSYYNPDPALYDGVYMSNLFGEYEGSDSKGMRIIVKGYGKFSLYVRCGSSSDKESVSVSMDSGSSIKTVRGGSGSSKDIDGYTLVEVPVPDDGKAHTIFVTFERFNNGKDEGDEFRGFVLIPKVQ